jgi:isopenicillin N synthase-like dioxygenase
MSSLPVIDLTALERGDLAERRLLRETLSDSGAFVLRGHGVPPALADALLDRGRAFFALPQAEREAIDMIHSPYFRGYSVAGSERTDGRPDLREQFDVGPEETPYRLTARDPAYRRLHGPNAWPHALPELRPALLDWMELARGVCTRLLAAIAASIGLPRDYFASSLSGQPHERLKLIQYPPVAEPDAQGVGAHTDSGFLSLIVQDGTSGLEAHDGRGFAGVVTGRGEFVLIAGRALQAATHDAVRAARHRVTSPRNASPRLSVAYFLNPRLDDAGYGEDALAVVLRSHPLTARRFFADLVAAT